MAVRSSGLAGRGRRATVARMPQPSRPSSSSKAADPPRKVAVTIGCAALSIAVATISARPMATGHAARFHSLPSGETRARSSAIAGNARARASGTAVKTKATSSP